MKKTLTKSLSVLTAILMLCCILPFQASAEEASELWKYAEKAPFAIDTAQRNSVRTRDGCHEIAYVAQRIGNRGNGEIWDGSIAESFAGGSGTEADPYLISDGAELAYLAQQVNSGNNYANVFFRMTDDIYLNDTEGWEDWGNEDANGNVTAPVNEWTAIGETWYDLNTSEQINHDFSGIFDGNGYTVYGMYINKAEEVSGDDGEYIDNQGLFGYAHNVIANVNVDMSYIHGSCFIGSVVGLLEGGAVVNCTNAGKVAADNCLAGIVGIVDGTWGGIADCHNSGTIKGRYCVGGIFGRANNDSDFDSNVLFIGCSNEGEIGLLHEYSADKTVQYCGGIAGYCECFVADCENTGNISGKKMSGGILGAATFVTDCVNSGNVEGAYEVGGVLGSKVETDGTISYCINSGCVNGEDTVGGVVGDSFTAAENCYNTGDVHGNINVGGVIGTNFKFTLGGHEFLPALIIGCYNIGNVSGSSNVGGLAGANVYEKTGRVWDGTVVDCYYLDSCCETSSDAGIALTDAQMRQEESFAGFDFHNEWAIEPDTGYAYPQFMKKLDSNYGGVSAIWDGSIAEGFAGGTGTQADPYIIETAEQLAYFADAVNNGTSFTGEYVSLVNDIILNDYEAGNWAVNAVRWTPIGDPVNMFCGTFDGEDHTVSGIYIDTIYSYQGLFGTCVGTISNVNIENSYIHGFKWIGGVVGGLVGNVSDCRNAGIIDACGTSGGIIGGIAYDNVNTSVVSGCCNKGCVCDNSSSIDGETFAGGIVGYSPFAEINNCYNVGFVNAVYNAGGITGEAYESYVFGCYNEGEIRGKDNIGGIVGTQDNTNINTSYNIGVVSGRTNVGGINGNNYKGSVLSSYNTGAIIGNSNVEGIDANWVGGICGFNDNGTVSANFNTGAVSGDYYVGGIVGANQRNNVINCYNTGAVGGTSYVGGIVGSNVVISNNVGRIGFVVTCYNVGEVTGDENVTGAVGYNKFVAENGDVYEGVVTDCYYLEDCCETEDSYSSPLTDAELRVQESYESFDFETVWTMEGNPDYPYAELAGNNHVGEWDEPEPSVNPGDYDCDGDVDVEDALLTLRAAMKLITPSAQSLLNADMDGDGVLATADALTILRMTMGLL